MSRWILLSAFLAIVPGAFAADSPAWGQCGGQGWTGSTTCVTGYTCTVSNQWYSQCIPGAASTSKTTAQSTATSTTISTTKTSSSVSPTSTGKANYWFSFGDSYTQTGFDISGTPPAPDNPLGNPAYPGWTATGGPNWIDAATVTYNHSLVLTYNFAYGGATIDANLVPPYTSTVLSLTDQVNQFLTWNSGTGAGKWASANALFSIWIGVNDIGNSYYKSGDRAAFSDTLLSAEFALIQKLYNVGARNFLFLNVPAIDRSPLMLGQSADAQSLEKSVIATHNSKYVSAISNFTSTHSGVKTWYYDTNAAFTTILNSPTTYGFSASVSSYGGANDFWGNDYHPSSKAQVLFGQGVGSILAGTIWQRGILSINSSTK